MFLDPALLTDPHERVQQILRDAAPIFWTPRNGGHWIAMGHKEVFALSRDTDNFSSVLMPPSQISQMLAMVSSEISRVPLPTPINLDPPDHTRYRAPLQLAFSPKAMLARRDEIRQLADSLIEKVIDRGHCDFIPEIAEPLPVQVFLRMMGLPIERQAEFRDLVHAFLAPPTGDPTEVLHRMRSVADAMKDVIEARRLDPRADLISQLWKSEIDGKPMTFEIMEDYAVLLFIAGLDTSSTAWGTAFAISREILISRRRCEQIPN
jgi:cytochrome P450